MGLVYINQENHDPEKLLDINLKDSIVISTIENGKCLKFNQHELVLCSSNEILVFNQKLNNNKITINLSPPIKWSVPKDISLKFTDYNRSCPYIENIYANYNVFKDFDDYSFFTIKFNLIFDQPRVKTAKINLGEELLSVNTEYGIFRELPIENIYLIENTYIFQEFELHFDR